MLAQPVRRLLLLLAVLLRAGGLGDANGGGGRSRAGTTPDASVAARAGRQTHALVASSARRMLASASRSSGRRAQEGGGCDRSSKRWHVQPEEQPAGSKGAFLFGTYHFDAASSWPHVPDNKRPRTRELRHAAHGDRPRRRLRPPQLR